MSKELGERMKEIYEETICKVRAEGKIEREFWTLADLCKRLEKTGKGEVEEKGYLFWHTQMM